MDCQRAMNNLGEAWLACEQIRDSFLTGDLDQIARIVPYAAENAEGSLKNFYHLLGRNEFEGHHHNFTNLHNQVEQLMSSGITTQIDRTVEPRSTSSGDMLLRYVEDIQRQILGKGLPSIIECQCDCRK